MKVKGGGRLSQYQQNHMITMKTAQKCRVLVKSIAVNSGQRQLFDNSEKRQIGSLSVSPLGLGTWAWGNKFLWNYDTSMDVELQQVFNFAVARGINLFDTADSYGTGRLNGRSEYLLGKFIREYLESNKSANIHIATKFAAYPWRVFPQNIVWACQGSLRRLGMQTLSLGQLHWSTSTYAPLQEYALWNGLADCFEQGLVQAVGVSNYGPREVGKICKKLSSRNILLSSAQVQFSLLSYGSLQRRLLQECEDRGVTVIAYSPLALGLLTGKYSTDYLPNGPRSLLFKRLLPKAMKLLDLLQIIAVDRRKTLSQVAINWCMCKGTIPIPGVKTMSQVEENVGALGWKLNEAEILELDKQAKLLEGVMVQNIFQTS
eukprot:TRINITY_DN10318_c1_g1_i3.p1 TRINITY_DN10318_c1_g1~~TRINITY_DN10318_c1_g1_i3.p1  ORF type:complete len:374 (-),score=15.31 TRINITY_DN10318_c1_g1_i3:257-1378(-)